jgi:hypothetical protein
MHAPSARARDALGLLLAAAVAFLGAAAVTKAGRLFPALAAGQLDGGRPGPLLAAVVVVLALAGGLLAALAVLELLAIRRDGRPPSG